MGISTRLIKRFYEDRNLLVKLHYVDVRSMWKKSKDGDVLFSPLITPWAWKLQQRVQVFICILWSLLLPYSILSYPIACFGPLSQVPIILHVTGFLCLISLYIMGIHAYLWVSGAIKVPGARLTALGDSDFRQYLKGFVDTMKSS